MGGCLCPAVAAPYSPACTLVGSMSGETSRVNSGFLEAKNYRFLLTARAMYTVLPGLSS